MSKIITFQINQKDVLHQVKLRSYYQGDALKDDKMMESAAKMQANDDNDDVLSKFAISSSDKLIGVLNPVCADAKVEYDAISKAFKYSLTMAETYADSQTNTIKDGSLDYMINWSLFEWTTFMFPSSAKTFYDKCALIESDIRRRINKRIKPV